ncbi:MAG: hypothetical protein LBJ15_03650 [Comamonas sp.]|jgi:hypothetical protein|uniref:hypothetical protein n=1 Tax=Comamonas sp. TaxID=34028 RepID=UPI0028309648|nr:hypothetical protein [Comamonas sp.]MDR0213084.1 hypothetical protein [Comamonas sp.]MDR2297446.1 hypothetical protein [Comamonas sp.]
MMYEVFENADSRRLSIAAQLEGFAYVKKPGVVKICDCLQSRPAGPHGLKLRGG